MVNRREKILIMAVVAILAVVLLQGLGERLVLNPLKDQRLRIQSLDQQIATKSRQVQEALQAQDELNRWRQASLPPDLEEAQAQYQDFLFWLVEKCPIRDCVITPQTPREQEHYTRIPFQIRGRMSLEDLVKFLTNFYTPGLLHQIRRLDLQPQQGDELSVTMNVEALALKSAKPRDKLVPPELAKAGPLADLPPERLNSIASANPFKPYQPPQEKPAEEPEPEIDEAKFVRLVGTPELGNGREAWLYDRLNNRRWVLFPGQNWEIAGLRGKVIKVEQFGVIVEMDQRRWRLGLNKSLRELEPLSGQPLVQAADTQAVAKAALPTTHAADDNGNSAQKAASEPAHGQPPTKEPSAATGPANTRQQHSSTLAGHPGDGEKAETKR